MTGNYIDVSIPLNTGIIGGEVDRIVLKLPINIPFEDFMSQVCARMGLDPRDASLGYKYKKDLRRSQWHPLASKENLQVAMDRGAGYIRRARKHLVVLQIENLVRAISLLLTYPLIYIHICLKRSAPQVTPVSKGRKRRADNKENSEMPTNATAKKCKIASSPEPHPTATTVINNSPISNYAPLNNIGGQRHINVPGLSEDITPFSSPRVSSPMNAPGDSRISSPIEYPTIDTLLQEMHDVAMLAHYNFPQYEAALVRRGITSVNDVPTVDDHVLVELGFPAHAFVLDVFRDRAARARLAAEGYGVSQPRI